MRHSKSGIMTVVLASAMLAGASIVPIEDDMPATPRDTKRKPRDMEAVARRRALFNSPAEKPQHKQTREMARRASQMARDNA